MLRNPRFLNFVITGLLSLSSLLFVGLLYLRASRPSDRSITAIVEAQSLKVIEKFNTLRGTHSYVEVFCDQGNRIYVSENAIWGIPKAC